MKTKNMVHINKITINALLQLSEIILQLDNQDYAKCLDIFNGASMGQHVRHIVEFYQCLLNGVNSGVVNYDLRVRSLEIGTNKQSALAAINTIIDQLNQPNSSEKIVLQSVYDEAHLCTSTNCERELVYLLEHSIHHFAIIEIGLRQCLCYVKVPQDFGVAYSTISNKKEAAIHQ